jgi:multidrug efflux system outer membrane protein
MVQSVFAGGQLKSNLRYAESQERQALLTYMQTIQKAFGDVSDAVVDVQKYREVRIQNEQYVKDLTESLRLSEMRYNGGIATYLEVLDAQRSRFTEQLTLAQSRGNEFQSVVQLYRALGGGWQ